MSLGDGNDAAACAKAFGERRSTGGGDCKTGGGEAEAVDLEDEAAEPRIIMTGTLRDTGAAILDDAPSLGVEDLDDSLVSVRTIAVIEADSTVCKCQGVQDC